MGAACGRCTDCLMALAAKEGDSPADTQRKRLTIPVFLWLGLVGVALGAVSERPFDLWRYSLVAGSGVLLACVAGLVFTRISPAHIITSGIMVCLFCLLGMDVGVARTLAPRLWSMTILLLDAVLVLNLAEWTQRVLVGAVLVYLAVERAEALLRFGLYDWAELGAQYGDPPPLCDCDDPPCSMSLIGAVSGYLGFTVIFVTDFHLTRGFASGLRRQLQLVDASIAVAERVAVLLAAYSVADAERVVEADGAQLPPAFRAALELQLANLRSYRPYLPESLLQAAPLEATDSEDFEEGSNLVDPPGVADDAEVSLCFTDIESSTALWEAHPQGMYEGLQLHNRVMRRAAAANNGYEVKTIGDAFMLAFSTPLAACRFALAAQRGLLRQQWPADLLCHERCATLVAEGEGGERVTIWHGLRVRIGINCGPARAQRNPVTGRYDYFGGTVNVAARVEAAVGAGGLIGVTPAVLGALGESGLRDLGSPALFPVGPRELKGVREAVHIHLMVPQELAARHEGHPAAATLQSGSTCLSATLAETMESQSSASPVGRRAFQGILAARRNSSLSSAPSRGSVAMTDGGSGAVTPRERSAQLLQGALGLQLQRQRSSCAMLRVPLWVVMMPRAPLAAHLAAIEAAADSSGGALTAVLSAQVLATWNAAKPCADHSSGCALFLQAVQRDHRLLTNHVGAASGEALIGNVAAGRRRFATVIGSMVELAAALAEEAELCGDAALAAGPVAALCAAAGLAHRAQLWREGSTRKAATVWELTLRGAGTEEQGSGRWGNLLSEGTGLRDEWDAALARAFEQAAELPPAEQLAVLQPLCDSRPEDGRAARLLLRAQKGALHCRRVPALGGGDAGGDGARDSDSPRASVVVSLA